MEGNLRQGTPPPSSDPAMEGGCRRKAIRMVSETSGLTGENSRTFVEEEMDSLMAGSMFIEWTDEKHSLYLNSMEELFVKQLHDHKYCSKDLLAGQSKNDTMLQRNSSGQLNGNNHVSSGQFKVLWDGCWQKNNFERTQPQSIVSNEHHGLSKNPWIQHFRGAGKQGEVKLAIPEETDSLCTQAAHLGRTNRTCCGVTSPKRLPAHQPQLLHQDFVGRNTEVSDQNFIEEDHDGEKCSSVCSTKRVKNVTVAVSSKDQVVPHGM